MVHLLSFQLPCWSSNNFNNSTTSIRSHLEASSICIDHSKRSTRLEGDMRQVYVKWQFPHCLGAVDGKHVVMMKPWKFGSLYYNYKGTCSIVLMALVDADLKFIAISTGSYGRNSDGGIFSRSNLGKRFIDGNFNFPSSAPIPGYENLISRLLSMSHVIVP